MTTENWIQLLVPVISIFAAIITAAFSYYFTEKSKTSARAKLLKEKCYIEYINAISNNVLSDDVETARNRLSEATNQILLIGSSEVVQNLRLFTEYIGPTNIDFKQIQHDQLITNLIKSMRKDLYKKRKTNQGYPQIAVTGKKRR